jgi:fibronectin type 3 domain-containing protein
VTYIDFSLSTPPTNVVGALALSSKNLVIKVNWDAVENATSYNVYRSENYYGDYMKVAENITTNSWTDKSPKVGSSYYKIQAVDHGLSSQMSSPSNVVNCSLDSPGNVKSELALDENKFVIKVTWDAVQYAESYLVYRSTSTYSSDFIQVAKDVKSNSWIDKNSLEENTTYYYKIVASGHGLNSDQSYRTDGVSLSLSTPSNVSGELLVNNNKLAINVKWDVVSLAESYIIYRSNDSWYGSFEKVAENINSNSWIDEDPLKGSNYYRVVAVGHGLTSNQSSSSDWVNYSIPVPTNVKSEQVLKNNKVVVNLSWDEVKIVGNYSAESYIVYRSDSYNGEYVKIADNITSTSWTDESPMDGNNYYKVSASGYGLNSGQSSYTSVTKN